MKKADLEKHLGQKIVGRMKQEPQSDRYGTSSGSVGDKREQRERDKAAGLVPFAVKLPQDLVARLQSLAVERGTSLNDVTGELLAAALTPTRTSDAAKAKPAASKSPAATSKGAEAMSKAPAPKQKTAKTTKRK